MPHHALSTRGLYAITNATLDTAELLDKTQQIIAGGAVLVQYRNPKASPPLKVRQAQQLVTLCQKSQVPLIINDDPTLAVTVGAAGVHLGVKDPSVAKAREIVGGHAVIGCSCHADLDLARAAIAEGADYLAFGAFFASPSKPDACHANPKILRKAKRLGNLPIVAIGGITPENGDILVAAGADYLAVISGVYLSGTPMDTTRAYCRLFHGD